MLDEAIWKELWVYWNSNAFIKKSNAAKMNRPSTTGVGSSVHTGGSIPINAHKKKMVIISSLVVLVEWLAGLPYYLLGESVLCYIVCYVMLFIMLAFVSYVCLCLQYRVCW